MELDELLQPIAVLSGAAVLTLSMASDASASSINVLPVRVFVEAAIPAAQRQGREGVMREWRRARLDLHDVTRVQSRLPRCARRMVGAQEHLAHNMVQLRPLSKT